MLVSPVLKEIGFSPKLINGGYKHWRNEVMSGLPKQIESLKWRVLSGPTGVGKTRWLKALAEAGESTLDLEGLGDIAAVYWATSAADNRLNEHLKAAYTITSPRWRLEQRFGLKANLPTWVSSPFRPH